MVGVLRRAAHSLVGASNTTSTSPWSPTSRRISARIDSSTSWIMTASRARGGLAPARRPDGHGHGLTGGRAELEVGPLAVVEVLVVEDHVVEVGPDALVVGAAVAPAHARPLVVHVAVPVRAVVVGAPALRRLADDVGVAQIPLHVAGLDLGRGEREGERAAHGLADVHAGL